MGVVLALFTVTAPHGGARRRSTVFLVAALGSVLVVNLQMRLMHVAGDAQTLGAAMNHASLNLANALGAWLGGLVIAAGLRLHLAELGRCRRCPSVGCWCSACRCCCTAGIWQRPTRPLGPVAGADEGAAVDAAAA